MLTPKGSTGLFLPLLLLLIFIFIASGIVYSRNLKSLLSLNPNLSDPTASTAVSDPKVQAAPKTASTPASNKPKPIPHIPQSFGKSVHVPILTYHYIRTVTNPNDKTGLILSVEPAKFEAQIGYLASQGFTPVTFDTLYAALKQGVVLPKRAIILTFDDGYIDFYINAFPILKKYNFQVVAFIPTGLIGGNYYLHWDQIKEMNSSGLVSFQAHSVSHPNLTNLNLDQLRFQVFESKKILESQLGKPVNTFAYPYGASNEITWEVVKRAGFVGSVGTWYGTDENEGIIYDMPRIRVSGNISLSTFAKQVNQ